MLAPRVLRKLGLTLVPLWKLPSKGAVPATSPLVSFTKVSSWSVHLLALGATFVVGGAGTVACGGQNHSQENPPQNTVPLKVTRTSAQSENTAGSAFLVFIHGLDSWRGTWRPSAEELAGRGFCSIAVDLRGHGESPLGYARDFGPYQLAADVRAAVLEAGLLEDGGRIVLVGHSMGGMVAMRYAAQYPEDLQALVIEDIDCVPWGEPPPSEEKNQRLKNFNRHFPSVDACQASLGLFGYGKKRMQGWLKENPPRLFSHPAGGVWSAINPEACYLATTTVGNQYDAYNALHRIAAARACNVSDFKAYLFVAGLGELPAAFDAMPGGVRDMESVLPGLQVTVFPKAYHSIHNSALMEFVDKVETILQESLNIGCGSGEVCQSRL